MLLSDLIGQDIPLVRRGCSSLWTSELHDSLIVDNRRGKWNWYNENKWGDAQDWLVFWRSLTPAEAKALLADDKPTKPVVNDRPPLSMDKVERACANLHSVPAQRFLAGRGISPETAQRLKLGYLPGKLVIPHLGPNKELRAIRYRLLTDWHTPDGRTVRYFSERGSDALYPYGVWDLPDGGPVLFIAEGELKTAVVRQLGYPCLGTQGLLFRREWLYFLHGWQRVIYLRDTRDLGGVLSAKNFRQLYPKGEICQTPSPHKAVDDYYASDPPGCQRFLLAATVGGSHE